MVFLLSLVFCLVNQRVGGLIVLSRVSFPLLYKKSLGMDNEEVERCEAHRRAEGSFVCPLRQEECAFPSEVTATL